MIKKLSHLDTNNLVHMVDVGEKPIQKRIARAKGCITLQTETLQLIQENKIKKGNVLNTAKLAGIQAAKQTSLLIPLCHTLNLEQIGIDFDFKKNAIEVESMVKTTAKTGAEMEALTAVSAALLTIYDMCKAVDKHMKLTNISLIEKIKRSAL